MGWSLQDDVLSLVSADALAREAQARMMRSCDLQRDLSEELVVLQDLVVGIEGRVLRRSVLSARVLSKSLGVEHQPVTDLPSEGESGPESTRGAVMLVAMLVVRVLRKIVQSLSAAIA